MKLFSLIQAAAATTAPAVTEEATESLVERIGTGLGNLVLGILVVFAVLTVLCIVLTISGKIFAANDAKVAAKKKAEAANAPAPAPVPVEEEEDNDEELVAAITAAVALCLAENGEAPAFKVVSFRKTYSKQSWNN